MEDVTVTVICKISIHAPAGGASWADMLLFANYKFQFTPLREGLLTTDGHIRGAVLISIHAPAGGASNTKTENTGSQSRFQFTPLREGLQKSTLEKLGIFPISIHAPAGGASAYGCI